jgi:D-alanyl-lipoteichoic acid acyltransferase DltB (MBOAT superfamily)
VWRHVAYLVLWPGLDAKAFLDPTPLPRESRASAAEWLFACAKIALGATLVWVIAPLVPHEMRTRQAAFSFLPTEYARAWVGMTGIVFVLHFGLFHVLSCAWRAVGVDAKPLMNWPLLSQSVSEFWGKRWNLAFRDITHRFLFRPLAARGSARGGLVAVFVFSGVVHDVAISLPAGGGYGLPTLYFVIQALALFVERSKFGKRVSLGKGVRGRLFTAMVLIAPACGLFHPWFAREVVLPFLDVIGAK